MMTSGAHRQLRDALKRVQSLGYTPRERSANLASLYFWGHQYDHLAPWGTPAVAFRDKAPSVRVALTRSIVQTVVAHLFGQRHTPTFSARNGDELAMNARLDELVADVKLAQKLPESGRIGGLHGSVGLAFHVFSGRFDVEVLHLSSSTPVFGRDERMVAIQRAIAFDDLISLDERWRSVEPGEDGQSITVWHRRFWGIDATIEYAPIEAPKQAPGDDEWKVSEEFKHDLGFVPVVWIKNSEVTNDIDGAPLVGPNEFEIEDEINYTLSQTGRGIRYNQEPTLVLSNVSADNTNCKIRRGADNTILLEPEIKFGDKEPKAELLEMEGEGADRAMAYTKLLRDFLYQVSHVVMHDPERNAGAISGVALERIKEPLVLLVEALQVQYGAALALFLEKMLRATGAPSDVRVTVAWPPVITPTSEDALNVAQLVTSLMSEGLLPRRKAIEMLARHIGVVDIEGFIADLDEEAATAGTQPSQAPSNDNQPDTTLEDLGNL